MLKHRPHPITLIASSAHILHITVPSPGYKIPYLRVCLLAVSCAAYPDVGRGRRPVRAGPLKLGTRQYPRLQATRCPWLLVLCQCAVGGQPDNCNGEGGWGSCLTQRG